MNAKRSFRLYVEDILQAIRTIESYALPGKDLFFSDTMRQDAVIRQLSIIGEAAAKLPQDIREQQPHIPWNAIVGMRNIIIHDYTETDVATVWAVIDRDLPLLRTAVEAILQEGVE